MFMSGQEFKPNSLDKGMDYKANFNLNDQVSSFVVTVTVFSNTGKYGFLKQTIVSSKMTYSQFTLPSTLITGDSLNIPIQVFNNRDSSQVIKVEVE